MPDVLANRQAGLALAPRSEELRVPPALAGGTSQTFTDYCDELTHSWAKIIALLGVALIPVFLLLDAYTMPEQLRSKFALYRLVATLISLGDYFVLTRTRPSRYSFLHGYFFTLIVGGMIVKMTVDLGGFNSAYYAGLNLVMVAINMLLPWRARHSALNGISLIALYVAANAAAGQGYSVPVLINNLYFLAATTVIAVAITFTKHRLIAQEFQARGELMQANRDLDRSRLELKAARDALWGEMEVAKRIQTALLPPDQRMGPYEVAVFMQPADEVGGDYYDLLQTRACEHWLAIGDVSGHGVESGLVMMMTQTSLLSTVNDTPGLAPSEVFRAVNGVLRENISRLGTGRYMTLNLVKLHEDHLTLAGKHQDVLVFRAATGEVETVVNEGCWIGVVPDTKGVVADLDVPLAKGDLALFFTDGITEATDANGEMFGQDRLAQIFQQVAQEPLTAAREKLISTVARFQQKQDDDITFLLVRRS
jgi:sigma-B regulation protein RsbU (phosphoserine phosphatase)